METQLSTGIVIIIVAIAAIVVLLYFGKGIHLAPYAPTATVSLSQSAVNVSSGALSRQVSATVTRSDNSVGTAAFVLRLAPSNPNDTYAVGPQSSGEIGNLTTVQLPNSTSTGDEQTFFFRVYGAYPQGQASQTATFLINVSVLYEGRVQQTLPLTVIVSKPS